jgi:SOS-response transcriptional repressor LexA
MMEEKTDTIAKKTPEATVSSTRPTKKQKELLNFIEEFINVRGYSPSYREIMKGMQYTSVATVSLHVNSLIKRGHLHKRDRSARSLEVVKPTAAQAKVVPKQLRTSEAKWLVDKVEQFFKDVEQSPKLIEQEIDQLYVLIGALKVLGIEGASQAFIPRLTQIKKRKENSEYVV